MGGRAGVRVGLQNPRVRQLSAGRVITEGFLEEAVGLEAADLGVRHLGSD